MNWLPGQLWKNGEETAAIAYLKRALAASSAEGGKAPGCVFAVLGILGLLTGRPGLVKRTRAREDRYDQWLIEWKQWAQAVIDSWEEHTEVAAMKRAEFTQRWTVNILDSIDAHVPEETKTQLMESCGRACARAEAVQAVEDCAGDYDQLQSTLRKWLGKNNVRREGDIVHLRYDKCFCHLQADIPERLAETYCRCSCGWIKEVFETALGSPVEVHLHGSIKQGAEACRFEVHLA